MQVVLLQAYLWVAVLLHPFHISVTEINHNEANESLEISIKMFSDDLEDALNKRFGKRLNLGLEDQHPDTEVYLALYLADELGLSQGGQDLTVDYVATESNIETTWCYLEVSGVQSLNQLSIRNEIMFESFDDQKNMVHVRAKGETHSLLLDRRSRLGQLTF